MHVGIDGKIRTWLREHVDDASLFGTTKLGPKILTEGLPGNMRLIFNRLVVIRSGEEEGEQRMIQKDFRVIFTFQITPMPKPTAIRNNKIETKT